MKNLQQRLRPEYAERLKATNIYDALADYSFLNEIPLGVVISLLVVLNLDYRNNGIMTMLDTLFYDYDEEIS